MTNATLNLLNIDKLNNDNDTSWKNTINTMLIIDDLRFVLVEKCSRVPTAGASRNVRDAYERWVKANEEARAYILASLSEVLAKKYKNMVTARQIIDSLREMFGQPSTQLQHDALKYIFIAHMKKGVFLQEQVLNMMVHFNVARMDLSLTKPVRLASSWRLYLRVSSSSIVMML
ncbi:uncharacterized protein LOC120067456 [Benincasa hispida]|uniref:uncharacterized protein LOC120067456 n=1 Tax=Benincasa hispida TaxID=102211 RepID=UPI0019008D5C|nr:uncharacterized protein LOC120067456 [Benincasa hispida]